MKNLLKSKQIILEFQADPQKFKKYHKIKYKVTTFSQSASLAGVGLIFKKHILVSATSVLVLLKILKPQLKRVSGSRIFLPITKVDTIVTKKPKDTRMGRGKGAPTDKKFVTHSGSIAAIYYGLSVFQAHATSLKCLPKSKSLNKVNFYE